MLRLKLPPDVYGVTQSNRLSGHTAVVRAVALSRDAQLIASGSEDTTVKLWKQDGTPVATLSGHTATVWGVAISPDGQTIASASEDKTVKLWKQDGTLLTTLQGYNPDFSQVSRLQLLEARLGLEFGRFR